MLTNSSFAGLARQKGLSLIELMVSIVISSIVLGGVVSVVVSSRGTYETEQESSFIQENGRFAIETITRDLRLAGNLGCASAGSAYITNISSTPDVLFSTEAIGGFEFSAVGTVPIPPPLDALNVASDIIIMRYADVDSAVASGSHVPATNRFNLHSGASFNDGDRLVVVDANCRYASFFLNTSSDPASVTYGGSSTGGATNCSTAIYPLSQYADCPSGATTQSFSNGSDLMKYATNAYFVSDSTVIPGMPSLKRLVSHAGGTRTEELAQGVESLEVKYGIDTNADGAPNSFVDADAVADWATVVSAEVALILRSQAELAGLSVGAADGYLRQELSTAVKLRNR